MVSQKARADSLSLLLFTLRSGKLMAINLLKVSEIIACPPLTRLPESHPHVKGVATLRGNSLSVIDLSRAIGERPLLDPDGGCLIVTDISRSKQGLHVQAVSKIVHCLSTDIRPPPFASGGKSFITGVTQVDGTLVQVLDIEKVIHGITPAPHDHTHIELAPEDAAVLGAANILVVDDSQVALQQSVHTLRNLGIECHTARSAKEAIDKLLELQGTDQEINVVVSDIEMSEMDGYAFTRTLRETPDFQHLYVLLHTSLDSAMNSEKAKAAGANAVLTKFSSPELTDCLIHAARTVADFGQ
ncbi:chemotaxis protein CheV [Pseudomonas sp. FFUP_PS_473]|jgi:two-component system chemotaxis response regulator CheV|uniref:chemotaxis protein n=1 Tax=Pseudomonas TaxID=286 RepID=UPI0008112AA9|nr:MULTISPECIES: chemotaxis protein [Pseudomonas]MBP9961927.1 chemotaxis protein CheV [Pseudomonas sp.]MEE3632786.1 chemotaxis protein [Pseudomonas sp. AL 58]ATR81823.1 chemotaxis protein CheV [Pseudomonas sp. HLS-6]PLP95465.1 chemotaxis protein CheV [Pseudomonas sp. FFUP_PS_473]WJM98284.1 chemotaxis protein [Pseudomonas defluvii]